MLIEKLELKGYQRIKLSGIDHITYTPTTMVQLILGTNGSGKSSLLSELSPLPANSGFYDKDGYKRIWISHRGRSYQLESHFRGSNQHQFLCDGEELNPGHTATVQKELVKEHFNWTPELHDLMTGLDRFTTMPASKRRYWISKLSTKDYTYALGVYQKLATRNRDSVGAAKHLNHRLTTEGNNLKALEGLNGLEDRIAQLRSEVNLLLTSHDPQAGVAYAHQQELETLLQDSQRLSQEILQKRIQLPAGRAYSSYQDVMDDVAYLSRRAEVAKQLLERSGREYAELDATAADLGQVGEAVPEDLEEQIAQSRSHITHLQAQLRRFGQVPNAEQAFQDNQRVLDALIALFATMPDNTDRIYTRPLADATTQRIRERQQTYQQSDARLAQIRHRRGVIQAAKAATCPSCGYVWKEGFSETELAQLDSWQAEHEAICHEQQRLITADQQYLDEFSELSAQYATLRGYTNSYPTLKPLWDEILEKQLHLNQPGESKGLFVQWAQDTECSLQIERTQHRLGQLELLAQRQADGTLNHLAQRRVQLTAEIEQHTTELREVRVLQQEVERYRQVVDFIISAFERMNRMHERIQQVYAKLLSATRNQYVDRVVHAHQDELATIQRQLSEKQTLEGIVRDLESSRYDVQLRQKAYQLLAECLSPTEGMIAEQMTGFIGCLVDQMNSIIEQVWSYDLMVQPCGLESGELDYKFPLFGGVLSKDVSLGSVGQQDVVNLAFVLTVMLYLNLSDVPLFLDEPGAHFDPEHRVNLMQFVKTLTDGHQHSQLFMISHYASQHGGFVNAETLVIDGTNIAVPQHANKHVIFA